MRLVVQGRAISVAHLTHIHRLIGGNAQFIQIGEYAYYLPVHSSDFDDVSRFCAEQKIDCALVPDKQRLASFGLCVMDFSESLKQRVSLLKGLDESALQRVIEERLTLNSGVREWIAACKENNIKTMVVSGGFTFFAYHVKEMLGLDYAVSNVLEIVDGKLTGNVVGDIVDAQRKADELVKIRDQLGLQVTQTIAIGDGANDLKMMGVAEIGIAYHAKPVVQEQATYALNHVGLDGAIHLLTA